MYFYTKITPWQFCSKHRQSGLVPFKSGKLESKTRAKVFGKVDTTEKYHGGSLPRQNKAVMVLRSGALMTSWSYAAG